ncbi:PilW family protein [Ottowia beijingensis]|uniref:PilW family protein n=1 Tax=Ottowia beijingensis TaxID=1207057 RepID=UPI0028048C2E|nr:PilW family protein [Ottowia beijingensis]
MTESQLRDCLGQNPGKSSPATTPVISSRFSLNDNGELVCTGSGGGGTQAIIDGVTDWQVRYAVQPHGTTTMQYLTNPDDITNWNSVYAVEVCLELTSKEAIGGLSGATYKNCNSEDASYDNRLKMVFRSTYQLRSQGLAG